MQSSTSKLIIAVVITAILVGSGVYLWQHPTSRSGSPVVQPSSSASPSLFDSAKNTKDEFTYLVSAPTLGGDWKMTLNNNFEDFVLRFSLTYKFSPWGAMAYKSTDLTATDASSPSSLPGVVSYSFCASQYYCDEINRKGMGFELTFWNATFSGRETDPTFYLERGDTFLKETDKYIVTYKAFSNSPQATIDKEVSNLLKSFELY